MVDILTSLVDDLVTHSQQTKIGTIDWYPWFITALIDKGDLQAALEQLTQVSPARRRPRPRLHRPDHRPRGAVAAQPEANVLPRPPSAKPSNSSAPTTRCWTEPSSTTVRPHPSCPTDRREAVDQLDRHTTFSPLRRRHLRHEGRTRPSAHGYRRGATTERSPFDLTDRVGRCCGPRRQRADQSRNRRTALRERPHGRVPPAKRVRQARYQLPARAARGPPKSLNVT